MLILGMVIHKNLIKPNNKKTLFQILSLKIKNNKK